MSDDEKPDVAPETATPSAETATDANRAISKPSLRHPLSRDTDHITRPGFRNPPNQGSKALKKPKRR